MKYVYFICFLFINLHSSGQNIQVDSGKHTPQELIGLWFILKMGNPYGTFHFKKITRFIYVILRHEIPNSIRI